MIFAHTGVLLGLRERGNGARTGMPGTHAEAEGHAGVVSQTYCCWAHRGQASRCWRAG
jgi:hypothetical protein